MVEFLSLHELVLHRAHFPFLPRKLEGALYLLQFFVPCFSELPQLDQIQALRINPFQPLLLTVDARLLEQLQSFL